MGGAFDDMGAFCTGEMYLKRQGHVLLEWQPTEGWKPACGVQSLSRFSATS